MKGVIKKLNIIKEAIDDWNKGVLSDVATLLVINTAVNEQPQLSEKAKNKVKELIEKDKKEKNGKKN